MLKEKYCCEPVDKNELFVHSLVFRKIALNITRACGKSEKGISLKELIPDCLMKLFDLPVSSYFAFAFDEQLVFKCLRTIRQVQPEKPFLIFVMGQRWHTSFMEAAITEKYKGIAVSISDVMETTKDGFVL